MDQKKRILMKQQKLQIYNLHLIQHYIEHFMVLQNQNIFKKQCFMVLINFMIGIVENKLNNIQIIQYLMLELMLEIGMNGLNKED